MSIFSFGAYALIAQELKKKEKIKRRILRDHSDPLDVSPELFVQYYNVNKEAFQYIHNDIKPLIIHSSIQKELKLAITLRFLAGGGFQGSIGNCADISIGRSTVCKILSEVLYALEKRLCPKWINLEMTADESSNSKSHFYKNFGIPGVIGCIDGTHINIIKPMQNQQLYLKKHGCFSVNTMIICDYKKRIRAVDATQPGKTKDAAVFNSSSTKKYLLSQYESGGERKSWLLGDLDYDIEPFLLTPYRNPTPGTPKHKFNVKHAKAHNTVKIVIDELKSCFKCLQNTLPYAPQKVATIVNVCCALHNVCTEYKLKESATEKIINSNDKLADDSRNSLHIAGQRIRDEISNSLLAQM